MNQQRYTLYLILLLSVFFLSSRAQARLVERAETYYSLGEIAQTLNMSLEWQEPGVRAVMRSTGHYLVFDKARRDIVYNSHPIWLGRKPLVRKGQLHITEKDFKQTLVPLVSGAKLNEKRPVRTIVIDPGHGGKDDGAINKFLGIQEKTAALDVALRLKKRLEAKGYRVYLTRTHDEFIPLDNRPIFANKHKADVFVSIHFNAVENGQATVQGVETYALSLIDHPSTSSPSTYQPQGDTNYPGNAQDADNIQLAYCVQKAICEHTQCQNRGLKRARFAVLRPLQCPGVLVEGGFLTHPQEARRISQTQYRERIAQGIAQGIVDYSEKRAF